MNIKKCIIPAPKRLNFLKLSQIQNGKLYFSPTFQKVELRNSTFFQLLPLPIRARLGQPCIRPCFFLKGHIMNIARSRLRASDLKKRSKTHMRSDFATFFHLSLAGIHSDCAKKGIDFEKKTFKTFSIHTCTNCTYALW